MPLNLASLLATTARVEVTFAGETFGVRYRPHAITMDVQTKLTEMATIATEDPSAALESLVAVLPILVDSWEIEDDGRALDVTDATLRRFPLALLGEVASAITADLNDPNRQTTMGAAGTPSSSGASRPALSALPRTGTG